MSINSENPEIPETAITSDAPLGSPNETDNSSAFELPPATGAAATESEEHDFFNDDYLSKLGASSQDPADDKSSDLSELPGFDETEPKQEETPEEKQEKADSEQAKPVEKKPTEEAEKTAAEKSESEKAIDDDPNLTDEDKAAIKELPKSRWKEFQRAKTFARTEAKFLDPNEKITDFLGHLEQKSPARLSELRGEILRSSVTTTDETGNQRVDGTKLLSTLFETTGAQAYTEVVASIVENYPAQAAELLKAKGFNLVENGNSAPQSTDAPALDDEKVNSILAQAEMYLDDEDVEYLRSNLTNRTAAKPEEKPADTAQTDSEKAAEGEVIPDVSAEVSAETNADNNAGEPNEKTASDEIPQPTPEELTNWNNAVDDSMTMIDKHLNSLMDDSFGLSVSDIEKTNIPELASVKDDKRHLLLHGSNDGSLKPFDIGLIERFREDEGFKKSFDAFAYFAKKGEIANAANAARELIPFAETLLEERLDHPSIKQKDAIIKRISDSFNSERSPAQDVFLDGSLGAGSGNQGNSDNTNSFLNPESL